MTAATTILLAAALVAQPAEPPTPRDSTDALPLVAYPHPLITEVLYAVPTGTAGDANKDGVRDAVGDEFVELINPHDRPIQLRGYTITDRQQTSPRDGKPFTSVRFTFPELELQPGEVAVVFNGHQQHWTHPVGDAGRAAEPSSAFASALAFTMNNASPRSAFANTADCTILWSPAGQPVHAICWGEARPPAGTPLPETAPLLKGQSITRLSLRGPMVGHPAPSTPGQSPSFSPGVFPPPP